jgi:hypothetical protein
VTNLGTANSWKETPQIVTDCQERNHERIYTTNGGRGITVITCTVCGYTYKVDSTD